MNKPYVLHLCSWYPNRDRPLEVSYVKEQVVLLSTLTYGVVVAVVESNNQDNVEIQLMKHEGYEEWIAYIPVKNLWIRQIYYLYHLNLLIKKVIKDQGRKPSFLHVHTMFRAVAIAWWVSLKSKIKYIVTEHHNVFLDQYQEPNKSSIIQFCRLFRRRASSIIAVSNAQRLGLIKHGFKCEEVIYNPVSTSIFNQDGRVPSDRLRIFHVSNLDPKHKKPFEMVALFNRLAAQGLDFSFTIIGSNPENVVKLRAFINSLDHRNKFELKEGVDHCKLPDIYKRHDVFALLSQYESFSIVVAEAIASGLYCIVSDCGGPVELVEKYGYGMVYDGDEKNIFKTLKNITIGDTHTFIPDLRDRFFQLYSKIYDLT